MPHLIDLRPGAAARRANVKQRLWVPQNCWRPVSACESRRRQRGRRSWGARRVDALVDRHMLL